MYKPTHALLRTMCIIFVVVFGLQANGSFAQAATPIAKARLLIPKIKVNAVIQAMGVTPQGAMAVPGNRFNVGWYSSGTNPGETGSAVIGGHNYWNGAGVFVRLKELKPGDLLTVVDAKGVLKTFKVRETHTYDAKDEHSGIFSSVTGAHLNLITCSGVWDPSTKSYTTRLVVFTDLVSVQPQPLLISLK